jgi:signal transduction histidine kinase/ligand-binding sensor domain-containing protein/DNA-binding response OmpR family regulator
MKSTLLSILFFLLSLSLQGMERYYFSSLTVKDGLSQMSVLCACQDSRGYMWFGTRNGLNCYDGYNFNIFYNDPDDTASISNNQILCITEDACNSLWIGTRNGLNRLDLNTLTFKRYLHEPDSRKSSSYGFIFTLCRDKNDKMWVGSDMGLFVYDRETDSFAPVQPDGIFKDNIIYAIACGDEDNILYIATGYTGLIVLNTETLEYRMHVNKQNDPFSLSNTDARCLYPDKQGNLWIGTYGGSVNFLKKGSDRFIRYGVKDGILSNNIRCLAESPSGEIVIGSSNGINVINTATGEISAYSSNDSGPGNLTHFSVFSLFLDMSKTLWVGTYSGGVNYYNAYANRFRSYFPVVDGKISRSLFSQLVEYGHYLYIATEGDGLLEYDKNTGVSSLYRLTQFNGYSYDKNILKSLYPEKDVIYCGTNSGSIYQFNLKTKHYTPFYEEKDRHLRDNVVYEIKRDSEGILCFSSVGNHGFLRIFPDGRTQKTFPMQSRSEHIFRSVLSFLEIEKGVFLMGTRYAGMFKYDFNSRYLVHYKSEPGRPETKILENQINQILRDSCGRIWLATLGCGICLFNPKKETFTSYTEKDGLLNNNVWTIIETGDGHLWLASASGITDFDPETASFKNYTFSDGIAINEFNLRSGMLASDGKLYFCGDNGFVSFNPAKLSPNPFVPPVVISNLYINNAKILPGREDGILKKNISREQEITLKSRQDNFSIEYAALSYVSSSNNRYAYKLEHFDKHWNQVGNRRIAYYTNVPPGTYVFRVKGSNNDGVWNSEGASIRITILPPFWRTWWAYVLYFLNFTLAAYMCYRYLKEKERLKNDICLKKMEAQAQEEFHRERNKFFTNFSHELRSPLTLLISPLEEMNEAPDMPLRWKDRISLMRNNARRLLRLVNNLMDFAKKENGGMKLSVAEGNIIKFAEEMYLLFGELALSRNICFRFVHEQEQIQTWYDRNLMEKVFFNFLSNAFKNTPNGGTVEMRIHRKLDAQARADSLIVEVEDSGSGIPGSELEKIFTPFYQVAQNEHASSGTGLGLSLSKSIIEMHHGVVWAENAANSGALFRCVLPISRACFAEDEIAGDFKSSEDVSHYRIDIPREQLIENHSKKKHHTILVVEDNADVRHYIVSYLEQFYQIIECSSGREGMEKAIHFLPDLIIADLMMSKMDGLEMSHRLKADMRTSHIPVIMVTARTAAVDIQAGYESGVDDYITKPFNSAVLLSRVKNLLQSREKLKEIYGKRFALKALGVETASLNEQFMQKLYGIMEKNLSNPELNLDGFCREIGMSRANLYRKIKAITGLSPSEFVRNFRLEMASKMLKESGMSVSGVYVAVGFSSHAYFSNCFKAMYGVSPSEYGNE